MYKYHKTITGGAERFIEGLHNLEPFLGDDDSFNLHDCLVEDVRWNGKEHTMDVVVNITNTPYEHSEPGGWDYLLTFHFTGVLDVQWHWDSGNDYIHAFRATIENRRLSAAFCGYGLDVWCDGLAILPPEFRRVPMWCNSDSPMKACARQKQSWFRQEILKCGFDAEHKMGKYGAYLLPEDAARGMNFFEGYRDKILAAIEERYPKGSTGKRAFSTDGLYANMLRSEHIPWNIFIPMRLTPENLKKSRDLFNEILGKDTVDDVTDIRIEWAPPYDKMLNDGTSFDAYIEYLKDGCRCGIGIEVKYTEVGYPLSGQHEKQQITDASSPYNKMTKACGFYITQVTEKPLAETALVNNDYRQIWRNHLLGAAMLHSADPELRIANFHSLTLYPRGNTHFQHVLPAYRTMLTPYGQSTFMGVTFEDFFRLLRKYFSEDRYAQWLDYLDTRYPFQYFEE